MKQASGQRKKDRRGDILAAATKVFGAKGYSAATVDEIAVAAGVSKGSMYNYFKSKQDLFTQLFLSSVVEDERRADELTAENLSAVAKLSRQLDIWFEQFAHYQEVGRLVLEFWMTAASQEEGPFTEAFESLYRRWRERLAKIFAQGSAAGEFELEFGPEMASSLVMALTDGIGLQSLLGVGRRLDPEYLAAVKKGIFDALGVTDRPEKQCTE